MTESSTAAGRSGFVTGLAWTFIILAAFTTVISALQNLMLLMFAGEMRAILKESLGAQPMPAAFLFFVENMQCILAAFLALSVGTLIASIGLLRRRNWARLVFIGFMALGVAGNLAGLALPFLMSSLVPEMPAQAPSAMHDSFKLIWNLTIGFSVVISLVFAALFAWTLKRLAGDDIRREFPGASPR